MIIRNLLLVVFLSFHLGLNQSCGTEVGNGDKVPNAKEGKEDMKQTPEAASDVNSLEPFNQARADFQAGVEVLFNNCRSPMADSVDDAFTLKITASSEIANLNSKLEIAPEDDYLTATDQKDVYFSYKIDAGADGGVKVLTSTSANAKFRNFTCGAVTEEIATYKKYSMIMTGEDLVERKLVWYIDESVSPVALIKAEITSGTAAITFSNTAY